MILLVVAEKKHKFNEIAAHDICFTNDYVVVIDHCRLYSKRNTAVFSRGVIQNNDYGRKSRRFDNFMINVRTYY